MVKTNKFRAYAYFSVCFIFADDFRTNCDVSFVRSAASLEADVVVLLFDVLQSRGTATDRALHLVGQEDVYGIEIEFHVVRALLEINKRPVLFLNYNISILYYLCLTLK